MNFSEFKIILFYFIFAQVTWQHMERPIARLIVNGDRHLKASI